MPALKRKTRRRIVVRRSSIHGKGVFATTFIPKGTRIIEYKGKRITDAAADKKYGYDEGTHTFLFLLDDKMVIDGNYNGNSARWINHGCAPNCEANEEDGRMFIDAVRDIKRGEELSYDYNLVLEDRYTPALKRLYACGCGAKRCRGTILASKR